MTGLEFIMAARAFPGERFALPSATLEIGRRIINRELASWVRAADTEVESEEAPMLMSSAAFSDAIG